MTLNNERDGRIEVADALRGLAVMLIVMLHCQEHFNFYQFPDPATQPAWLNFTDNAIWQYLWFVIGGKAYAIFALLFGFSFYIMLSNAEKRGQAFRWRFCWRMVLLFVIGNVNASFFTGEVLVLYSIVGLVLPLVCRLSTRMVLVIAAVCMLQPVEWGKLIVALCNPDMPVPVRLDGPYWAVTMPAQESADFLTMVKVNLWEGQLASIFWAWQNARFFQTASLFMLGMVCGRKGLFANTESNQRLWGRTLAWALMLFFPLYGLSGMLSTYVENPAVLAPLSLIVSSLHKFAFMTVIVCSVLFAYYNTGVLKRWLDKLKSYGRMSLTNYLTQSVVGSALFYHWGLQLHTGHTMDFFIGIVILVMQVAFCNWWMSHHKRGPVESLWRRLTWL